MNTLWFLVRLLFGAFFLLSGVLKLKDPILFVEAVRNYKLVGDPIAPAMALFVPWVEVVAGIGVMVDRFARGSSLLLFGSMLVFTAAIGISWMRGLDITCGCFGGNEELNYPVKMLQNLGLIVLAFFIWRRSEMQAESSPFFRRRAVPAS
ncbi:MAG: DoxX family membrane protein [Verrucomicrobiales bacterium]|jgi:uncharacterized membrane protein YphA (DoxX/SURF4 family)|nr:DoxX family membrane protein [Verrucomicrobiales bacterium]